MLEITKYQRSPQARYTFSVLIPTWNNLAYLKICIGSLQRNSQVDIQLIVIVNEGIDGTVEWVRSLDNVDYIHSTNNLGICYGLNSARSLIKSDYIIYANDDMYMLPDWDLELRKEIERIGTNLFMLSSTLIEPVGTGNPCVVVKDYGRDTDTFNEAALLREYRGLSMEDWSGSTWPPTLVHVDLWDLVGGMSIEFSPGMYSDPDFSRKLFQAGVGIFKGKGNSLVYHFGSKSTKRIAANKGRKTFLLKWGISSRFFTDQYLKRGKPFKGNETVPEVSRVALLINKIKQMISLF